MYFPTCSFLYFNQMLYVTLLLQSTNELKIKKLRKRIGSMLKSLHKMIKNISKNFENSFHSRPRNGSVPLEAFPALSQILDFPSHPNVDFSSQKLFLFQKVGSTDSCETQSFYIIDPKLITLNGNKILNSTKF